MSNELKESLVTTLLLILLTGVISLATYGICKWIDNPEWKEQRNRHRKYDPINERNKHYINHNTE